MGVKEFLKRVFGGKKEVLEQKAQIDFAAEKRKNPEKVMTEEERLADDYYNNNQFHVSSTVRYYAGVYSKVDLDTEEMEKRGNSGLRKISKDWVDRLIIDYGSIQNLRGNYPDLPSDWIKEEVVTRIANYVIVQADAAEEQEKAKVKAAKEGNKTTM